VKKEKFQRREIEAEVSESLLPLISGARDLSLLGHAAPSAVTLST